MACRMFVIMSCEIFSYHVIMDYGFLIFTDVEIFIIMNFEVTLGTGTPEQCCHLAV